jgi:membrane-associated phospholipid phosphatase
VDNDWLRDTGIMIVAPVTSSGIIQSLSKEAVGWSRPEFGRGAFAFKPFGGADYHSFPSGHTMLSVATSWILARQVGFLPLKIVFYTLPVITGLSRIYTGAHWLSDILLGSALGIACAESVLRLYPLIKENKKLAINMTAGENGMGIAINF